MSIINNWDVNQVFNKEVNVNNCAKRYAHHPNKHIKRPWPARQTSYHRQTYWLVNDWLSGEFKLVQNNRESGRLFLFFCIVHSFACFACFACELCLGHLFTRRSLPYCRTCRKVNDWMSLHQTILNHSGILLKTPEIRFRRQKIYKNNVKCECEWYYVPTSSCSEPQWNPLNHTGSTGSTICRSKDE